MLWIILSLTVLGCEALNGKERKFPNDFLFGAATAAYQIEGAWNADGKGPNIWDHMTHTAPHTIVDNSNGDVAGDTYNNYKRDVEMMRELGLDIYRFSISWSRILPTGLPNNINKAGIDFYNNYINEMLKYNITPMVTLYHWDLPQKLQELGGFANPLIGVWFEDYARIMFEEFGDRVKHWITFNEPREICYEGYGLTTKAPALNASGIGDYICGKHLILAHARVYHAYVNDYKPLQGGVCGITCSIHWFSPATDSIEDHIAAELKRQAEWGIYTDPIFSEKGGYPKEISERIAQKSKAQGFIRSRLHGFTEDEKAYIRGASDFLGVNHYSGFLISATEHMGQYYVPSMLDDIGSGMYMPDHWEQSASVWLKLAPKSGYHVLTHLHKKYANLILYITESGWSTASGAGLEDNSRVNYYRAALESMLDALEAGVNLKGYMAWSLMDNFEWIRGYSERFGLYEVDFNSPKRTRTPRKSAFVYKQIIKTRIVDHDYEPINRTMVIDVGH